MATTRKRENIKKLRNFYVRLPWKKISKPQTRARARKEKKYQMGVKLKCTNAQNVIGNINLQADCNIILNIVTERMI